MLIDQPPACLPFLEACCEGLQEVWSKASVSRLWHDYEGEMERVVACVFDAASVLNKVVPGFGSQAHQAALIRVFLELNGAKRSIFQYEKQYKKQVGGGSRYEVLPWARKFIQAAELQDHELLGLIAFHEAYCAADLLLKLLEGFDALAEDMAIGPRDDRDEERLRKNRQEWERECSRYASRVLSNAQRVLLYATEAAARFDPEVKATIINAPETMAKIVRGVAVENGRMGGEVRAKKYTETNKYAIELYKKGLRKGEWGSDPQAAEAIKDLVLAFDRTQSGALTESGAQGTIYRWILEYIKKCKPAP